MYTNHFSLKNPQTPQTEQIEGTQKNNAGGYSFVMSKWDILDRFLILGTEDGTYYVQERKLTRDNAKNVIECIQEDGVRVVNRIIDILDNNRSPKPNAAIFALALCTALGNVDCKKIISDSFSKIIKTGTQLFIFIEYVKELRGFGRYLKRVISSWYNSKDIKTLIYQIEKYKNRNKWTHYDVFNLVHPKGPTEDHQKLYKYICKNKLPIISHEFELLHAIAILKKNNTTLDQSIEIIDKYKLFREVVPTNLLNNDQVWHKMLPHMPLLAVIRNLNKMTTLGMINDLSETQIQLTSRLTDDVWLQKSKIHPLTILNAYFTYHKGSGVKGSLNWNPQSGILGALNVLFGKSFQYADSTKKRILLAVDVSGSMNDTINNSVLTCAQAAAALAMTCKRTEPYSIIKAFAHQLIDLSITSDMSFVEVMNVMKKITFGNTDCALPILWALNTKTPVDAFIVITDNETYAGQVHPSEAIKLYRKVMGIPAKMIVVGMTATEFTIADPKDQGMLDVVGFDTNMFNIISNFIK